MIRKEIIIYYSRWDGKNGSHALLKEAAARWCMVQSVAARISRHEIRDPLQFTLDPEEEWDLLQFTSDPEKGWDPSEFILGQVDTWKKPYFKYPKGVEFSISHSGELWMCAISDTPVGLDVQEANRCKRDKLSKRFFHPQEDAWLYQNQYGGFYQLWAAKESYLKYTGDGLSYGMERFSVVDGDGLKEEVDGVYQRHFVCSPERDKKDWSFEAYRSGGAMDIQPEEERMAVCISFKGERETRFCRL